MTELRRATCFFCKTPPLGEFLLTSDAVVSLNERQGGITRQRMVAPICGWHRAILVKAGERGRVFKRTGVRWWLGVH